MGGRVNCRGLRVPATTFTQPRYASAGSRTLRGRAIAYGKSRVGSETWRHAAFGCRRHALESDCEQTGIETRTAIVPVWRMQFGTASAAQVSSICDSPAHKGGREMEMGRGMTNPPPPVVRCQRI